MNLRKMIDSTVTLYKPTVEVQLKPNDDVVLRRQVNRSGPATNEVIVGRLLAMNSDGTSKVSIQAMGVTKYVTVQTDSLSKVTDTFRRQSMQLNPAFRPRA